MKIICDNRIIDMDNFDTISCCKGDFDYILFAEKGILQSRTIAKFKNEELAKKLQSELSKSWADEEPCFNVDKWKEENIEEIQQSEQKANEYNVKVQKEFLSILSNIMSIPFVLFVVIAIVLTLLIN